MMYIKRLIPIVLLVSACTALFSAWPTNEPAVLIVEAPPPGIGNTKSWNFKIRAPNLKAPVMASLSLQEHLPTHTDAVTNTDVLKTTTDVRVPIDPQVDSIIVSVVVEPKVQPNAGASERHSQITLALTDSKGETIGEKTVSVVGATSVLGYVNRSSQLRLHQEIKLVNLSIGNGADRTEFDVSFQFTSHSN